SLHAEIQSLNSELADQAAYLRLAETLSAFLARLRIHAQVLDVRDRQRITRLLIKEIVIADDNITIRHSIPSAGRSPGGGDASTPPAVPGNRSDKGYLLCPWRERTTLRRAFIHRTHQPVFHHAGLQK